MSPIELDELSSCAPFMLFFTVLKVQICVLFKPSANDKTASVGSDAHLQQENIL